MRRAGSWLIAAWWTGVLLAGPPLALYRLVGPPLSRHLPDLVGPSPTGDVHQVILAAAALAGWLLWAMLAAAVAGRAGKRAAGLLTRLPRLRLPGPLQGLSAAVLGTVAVTTATGGSVATPAVHAAVAAATSPAQPGQPAVPDIDHTTPGAPQPGRALSALSVADQPGRSALILGRPGAADGHSGAVSSSSPGPARDAVTGLPVYPVESGDWLGYIAQRYLGDFNRFPDIARLNPDLIPDPSGPHGPDHIQPGWRLRLPADAHDRGPRRHATGHLAPPAAPSPTPPASAAPSPDASPTASAANPSHTATHASPQSRSPRANPHGISLPGGSWVDLGLAAAIAAAAALVWFHRRRRYSPGPPSPALRLDAPDLARVPPVVSKVRRGLRHTTRHEPGDAGLDLVLDPSHPDTAEHEVPDLDSDADGDRDAEFDGDLEFDGGDGDAGLDEDVDAGTDMPDGAGLPDLGLVPVAPALDHALLRVWPPAGLGLTGPGGGAAARGFLVAALAAGGLDEPATRGQVVIPAGTLATLLGTEAVEVADTPRLAVTAGLPEALEVLEAATLHRTRLVDDREADTVAALRDADALDEPLPPLLLLADATAVHQQARIASLLTQGQRLDIHGVLLGVWPDGDTVNVAADGATSPADDATARHSGHPADVGRLAVLDPTETTDLLRTFAEAHTGQPQPAPPVEAPPAGAAAAHNDEKATSAGPERAGDGPDPDRVSTTGDTGPGESAAAADRAGDTPATDGGLVHAAAAVPEPPARADAVIDEARQPLDLAEPVDGTVTPAGSAADEQPSPAVPGRAGVFLLGPPRVDNLPPPSRTDPLLRPQAVELLVYLVVHGGSAAKDDILIDVLGDAPQKRAAGRLSTFVYSLRRSLKASAGGDDGVYVGSPEDNYVLNRDRIDIDLWRMRDAITAAAATTDPATRTAALREAVACYTGPLAEGRTYEWVEPYREAVRRQAIDAHLALVAETAGSDPAGAVAVLRAAIGHDPYNEALYQQAMRLHGHLRDVEAIRSLRRALTRRLGDIDAEPSPDTIALADQLITDLQHRTRAPRPVRDDAA